LKKIIRVYVVFLLCSLTAFAQEKKIEKVFVGYVYRPPSKINFKLYTHLCHAFVTADEKGVVRTNRNVPVES
jgi:chitinase